LERLAEAQRLKHLLEMEKGAVVKPWGGRIPIALVFPNTYSLGMANLGFQLVYSMLNGQDDIVCERFFWEEERDTPLSVESQSPLARFEIVAFSIPFENDFLNLPKILKASGVPLESRKRRPPHPMVWVGGITTSMNPEPLARFADLFAVGEAEELLPELVELYREMRAKRATKEECLEEMARKIEGVYVPSLYRVTYDHRGLVRSFVPKKDVPPRVKRRVVEDLDKIVPTTRVMGPGAQFSGMFLVEIGRGCPRRCRFCAAGHLFRPTRHRSLQSLLPALEEGVRVQGKVGLVSASVGDHPHLREICSRILEMGGKISVSSLRIDALEDFLLDALAKSGHKTVSLAPEAGSQRLRDLVAKGITEEEVLRAVEKVASAGIQAIRMYFMVGLPTETREDVDAIGELVKRSLHRARVLTHGKGLERITLSVSPFVPKPWTPFQWHPFMDLGEIRRRLEQLKRILKGERKVFVVHETPNWASIQALLARADRRIGLALSMVAEGMSLKEAMRNLNLNPEFYLYRTREKDELFPWDFLDHGFSKESLWEIYSRAVGQGTR